MSYQNLLKIRNEDIDGETNWTWIATDTGAWDGPKHDWIHSHKEKFFKYLRKHNVVVTAGANCGMYARLYAKLFKTVYAFEPDPLNFHCLVNNTQFDNVIKMQCALGSTNKLITLSRANMTNVGCHQIDGSAFVTDSVIPMITIDSLNLAGCDLLQLDVEQYELNVLYGAVETIKKYQPVITAENGILCKELLLQLGYKQIDQSGADIIYTAW